MADLVIGRWRQLELLDALVEVGCSRMSFFFLTQAHCPSIAVLGAPSCGKTHTLRRFVEWKGIPTAWVHCKECLSTKSLFTRIVTAIASATAQTWDGPCGNPNELTLAIDSLLTGQESLLLVLDALDVTLEPLPPTFLAVLCKLRYLVRGWRELC